MKYIENYKDTLFGSMVEAIGFISHRSPSSRYRLFYNLMHWDGPIYSKTTIYEILEYIWSIYGDDRYYSERKNLVLLTDSNGARSPIVGVRSGDKLVQFSNNPNLITLYNEGRDYIELEELFDEQGEIID